jgi:membrane protein
MNPRAVFDLLREAAKNFSEDKVPRLGAALAYYSVFSLAPLAIIAIGIASLLFQESARQEILAQIEDAVGSPVARAVEDVLRNSQSQGGGVLATVVGLVVLVLGASGVFVQLQDALNSIWHVAPKPGRGWGVVLRERFLSFAMVFAIGFLLLVSLVISAALSAVGKFVSSASLPGGNAVWQWINTMVSLGFITLLLGLIYKVLPDVRLAWRNVWIGAAISAVLFTVGKYLFGLYLTHTSTASAFGAAGSLVIMLVWVYYSSQIVLFGAELTRTLTKRAGQQVVAKENAVPLCGEDQARQGIPRREQLASAVR